MLSKRYFLFLLGLAVALSAVGIFVVNAVSSSGDDSREETRIKFYQYSNGLGVQGFDVVSYFTESRAVQGKEEFETNFAGITWRFSSATNRDKFIASPANYLPKYGGHCAYGVAQGYLVRGDPTVWSIKGGNLYLNYNSSIRNAWLADADSFVRRSENNWLQLNY